MYCAGAAFNSFNAAALLALNGMGPEAMVVCRSLLEAAMGAIHLAANPQTLQAYADYSAIVKHKIAKRWEGGGHSEFVEATKPGYDSTRNQFPNPSLSWHQMKNDNLADSTGFKDIYADYYVYWSSIAHGDAVGLATRISGGEGFQPPPAWALVDSSLELGAEIAARMFYQLDGIFTLDLAEHTSTVLSILDRIEPKRREARRFITPATPALDDADLKAGGPSSPA